jgi:uncharacterized protein (DUF885 family)
MSAPESTVDVIRLADALVEDAWGELRRSPYVQLQMSVVPNRLPDVSFAEAERKSVLGCSLLNRLKAIDTSVLPHDLALTLRLVRFRAQIWAREADWYWTVIDPRGIGSFGLFLPTAYTGGYLLNFVHNQLGGLAIGSKYDLEQYIALVADYVRLVDQFTLRTAGQAERGILMPRVQILQARMLLNAFRENAKRNLGLAPQRLGGLDARSHLSQLNRLIELEIEPAFERALLGLNEEYYSSAPEGVGMGQYPGGSELYGELVKLHTTLEMTPEEIHRRGVDRMSQIESSKRAIRDGLAFSGDETGFIEMLSRDGRWRAGDVNAIATVFERYLARLRPHLEKNFLVLPSSPCGVEELPAALEESMTYGYYDTPRRSTLRGRYLFNSRNMTRQALLHVAALAYHELLPGHHLHFATQQENAELHPFRKYNFVNAYNEGWAEYAATLAGELGMYETIEEQYGRLIMDSFLTCRLVVDTGMNVLGWSLERARDYMRSHSGMSEGEISTETIRYSCDRPAQALAYKLGDTIMLSLRERMRSALGSHFDIRRFHAAVLGPGALPLQDLQWHVEHEIHGYHA